MGGKVIVKPIRSVRMSRRSGFIFQPQMVFDEGDKKVI
jgi:hypothetical protein